MDNELYKKLCEELEITKYKECLLFPLPDDECLLSVRRENNEKVNYCSKQAECVECEFRSDKESYPEFTPKIQLELIKYLTRQENLIINYIYTSNEYGIASVDFERNEVYVKNKDFTNALLEFTLKVAQLARETSKPSLNRKELSIIIEKGEMKDA